MLTDLFAIATLTGLIMISPGPDLALVTRNTVIGGHGAGAWTSIGILTGNMIHISYCLLGVGWLIANSIAAFTVLKFAGGAYLVYLGVQSLRSPPLADNDAQSPAPATGQWFVQGLLNNILNPKGALFYLGVFAVFVRPETSPSQLFMIVLTMMVISAAFWVVFVYVLQIGRVRAQLLRWGQWINRLLGTVMIGLGIRLWFSHNN